MMTRDGLTVEMMDRPATMVGGDGGAEVTLAITRPGDDGQPRTSTTRYVLAREDREALAAYLVQLAEARGRRFMRELSAEPSGPV